jgi:ABC-2 type transport system permease protein
MTAYRIATRYTLLVLAKNRLAMVILVGFIPLTISLARFVVTRDILTFRYRATGEPLQGGGEKITMISCALNAVTLLVGFAMFTMAQRASAFDQRLIAAGYSRAALLLAKLTTLNVAAAIVGAYTTAWMLWYWRMEQPLLMGIGVFSAALLYGAIGLFLALFLPGELEGMFTIIMATVIDLGLQNPIINPAADAKLITLLPVYGAMQTCLGAGFTDTIPWRHIALTLVWATGCAAIAFAAFTRRTRTHTPSRNPLPTTELPFA